MCMTAPFLRNKDEAVAAKLSVLSAAEPVSCSTAHNAARHNTCQGDVRSSLLSK